MRSLLKTLPSLALFSMLAFALSACGEGSFFGKSAPPPLPGKRISVLVQEQTLAADDTTKDQEIVLPAPTENENWPQAGGYPNHAMHHILIADDIKQVWKTSIGKGSNDDRQVIGQPVAAGGRIYTLDAESELQATEARNGDRIWKVDLTPKDISDDHPGGGVAYDNGVLYVTTGFGQVIAVNAENGKTIWTHDVTAPMRSAPTVSANRVFVVTATNKTYALDGTTGDVLWNHTGIEEPTNFLGSASPAVDAGVVIVPYSSGEVFALRVENGQELWNDSIAGQRRTGAVSLAAIRGRPIIDRGVVYVTGFGGITAAINLRTGRRVWDREIGSIESPWIAGDYLFMISINNELVALNRADGRIHWVTQLPEFKDEKAKAGRIVWTGPVLASDRLIIAGSSEEAWSISPYTGETLGKVKLPDGVIIAPIIAGNTLYFLSDDADLVAYR